MAASREQVFQEKPVQFWTVMVVLLMAILLASHPISQYAVFGLLGNYLCWIFRIVIEAGCFIGVLLAILHYMPKAVSVNACVAIAIVLSLIPFTLGITAFDLIVGLPELGIDGESGNAGSRLRAFAWELVYSLDNHVAACLLLMLPQMISSTHSHSVDSTATQAADNIEINDAEVSLNGATKPTDPVQEDAVFYSAFEPPLEGSLCSIEAQEHYIKVISTEESRMVLYRFSDAVRHLPSSTGMQVHRSHWVAHGAVERVILDGQNMKLKLNTGALVPVSRTFRAAVEARHSAKPESSKEA